MDSSLSHIPDKNKLKTRDIIQPRQAQPTSSPKPSAPRLQNPLQARLDSSGSKTLVNSIS
ncbi:uncharacterized protein BDW70DRAFT_54292 [Aspergillus foveolatus]|uniref:uncharacterized protein n=1 Tax=Aspergillus foveolatus TaxID=210207 RepID=UPI003CCDDE92